ncbi:MAG: hypothetical protein EOO42_16485 [Flavobacteriales bacterium]|nr:MAG: hypothetical protein EOO42_16485 [Flavobacteriales bacterium]
MIIRPIFEKFRERFLFYFEGEVLTAEFDNDQNLIVFANPYVDYSDLVIHICESVAELVYFRQRLLLYLYPFGSNECLSIRIN